MKKLLTVLMVVVIASFLFANQTVKVKEAGQSVFSVHHSQSRDFITIIEEDFESGATDWEHYDETAPSDWNEHWHPSTEGAYAGNSWWMGDEDLGGYTSHRYLVLDTPALTLAATNPELNFMFSLCCEDTGGDPPYNAWDGANIRISTDNGANWTPIEGTPAYNGSSFYSFGYEFNEGVNIPGWGSTTQWVNWTAANFDLSSYAGQEVKIRFAFASDPAYDTADDPNLFGFRVDDIEIDTDAGTFESDADGAAGDAEMVAGYGGEVVGDLWHIYEDNLAPSPSNAMGCFDEATNSYLAGMSDFIISPEFSLPEEGIFTWDVYCQTMMDAGTFPDCDYIHVEVRSQPEGEDWTAWNSISNPLGNPELQNYVFTGAIDTWSLFTEGWGMEYADISMLAGREVQFRFGFHTNGSDEVTPGGFRIDNFHVMQEVYLGPAPENLIAQTTDDSQVQLTWDPISEGGEEGWLQWDDGVNNDAIGLGNGTAPYEFWVAASFDPGDLMAYVGGSFTELEVYIMDAPSAAIAYVWEGSMGTTEVASQTFTPTANDWNTITFDTPVEIQSGTEYWVGYYVEHAEGQHPAGIDAGPHVEKGDWIAQSAGAWSSLYTASSGGIDGNWNIHAYVDGGTRVAPATRDRAVTGYNVWRMDEAGVDYVNIGTIEPTDTPSYLDEDPIQGAWNYYTVTALYDGLDGAMSNEAMAYILPADAEEIVYDDGTSEEGYNVGIAQHMAVKFMPAYPSSRTLAYIKVYIHEANSGSYIFRIFEDDGGMPLLPQLVQFNVDGETLNAGWNTIVVPDEYLEDLTFSSGCFYVGIFEMANIGSIGFDTDGFGYSWKTVANAWEEVTDGNLMIRAILVPTSDENTEEIAPNTAAVSNYPNPFNPETTIAMNIPVAGHTTLSIYNVKGQLVNTLVNEVKEAGTSYVTWKGNDSNDNPVTSGIYFYKLETGNQTVTSKMIMLK